MAEQTQRVKKFSTLRIFIASLLLANVLFAPQSWNQSIAKLDTLWKVIIYIALTAIVTVLVYWPRGSKLSDIKRSDIPNLARDFGIVILATAVIWGLVALYIKMTA